MLPRRQSRCGGTGLSSDPDQPEEFHDAGLWTIPNLISFIRILGIPWFLWLLIGNDDPLGAALVLGAIGWTDFFDGAIARKLGQTSEIGKFLDPLADRLAIFAAVVGGVIADVVPAWLGWPLIVREVVVGVGALFLVTRLKTNVQVRRIGKVATAIVYGAIPSYYLAAADIEPEFFGLLGALTGAIGLILYVAVTWQYVEDVREAMRRTQDG